MLEIKECFLSVVLEMIDLVKTELQFCENGKEMYLKIQQCKGLSVVSKGRGGWTVVGITVGADLKH